MTGKPTATPLAAGLRERARQLLAMLSGPAES